jgi:UDP-2-acetamido-3-amino-2,3-dideoxy-glucuronate N-acetyltransferase
MDTFVHQTADIDDGVSIEDGSKIWHHVQIRKGAVIGAGSIIGRGAYVGSDVRIGKNCKIQNYALVYEPAHLEDGVFVGPAAVLTNDLFPRAVTPDMGIKNASDWTAVGVTLRQGASIGARAVCIAPVTVGQWAMVAAGAVVTKDVPAFALVVGVPARQIGWVGKQGKPLEDKGAGVFECPADGSQYRLISPNTLELFSPNTPEEIASV